MDHRYYGLKALTVAVGIALAILSSAFGTPRLGTSMAHTHYSAAVSIEIAMSQSFAKASRAVGGLIRACEEKSTQP